MSSSSSSTSPFKFATNGSAKQRVAHKGASSTLLQDLEHKKQSIARVLSSSPKKPLKQSTLTAFFGGGKPKRQKSSKRQESDEEYEDEFIDDGEQDSNGPSSDETATNDLSETDEDDDLAIGGKSAKLNGKPEDSPKLNKIKAKSVQSKPSTSTSSNPVPQFTVGPQKLKLPPPPPMDFIVKHHQVRAVLSSSDNDDGEQPMQKPKATRKAILLSDDDEEVAPRNGTITLEEEDGDGPWLSALNPPPMKKHKKGEGDKEKTKSKKPKEGTLKDQKRKIEKIKKKRAGSGEEEDFSEDSGDDRDVREQSVDSDDSEAGDKLSAREQKRQTELQRKCVDFVNSATEEELVASEKFPPRFLTHVLEKRPFESFHQLKEKTAEINTVGKRGCPNMVRALDNYVEWFQNRGILDQVLDDCRKHSRAIANELEEAKHREAVEKPEGINQNCSLHPYQKVGLNWLIMMNKLGMNAILADEMGLGKTIQVIAFLTWAKDHQVEQPNLRGPHLIVVPSSTIENWMQEIAHWSPNLRVLTYYGSIEERQQLRHSARKHEVDIILTTYSMVISRDEDRKFFKKFSLNYLIYDEGHMLRNCATNRYTNLMRVRGKRKILLTGTPLQNNLVELISLLYFTMRQLFDKYCEDIASLLQMFAVKGKVLMDQKPAQKGRKKKLDEVEEDGEEQMEIDGEQQQNGSANGNGSSSLYEKHKIEQAKDILQPFVLRRLKIEVLSTLPKKHEHIEFCEPTKFQAKLYAGLIDNLRARQDNGTGGGLGLLMEMRQVANHPMLYRFNYNDEKVIEMAKQLCLREKFYERKRPDYLAEDLAYQTDIALHLLCQKYDETIGHFALDERLAQHSGKCRVLDRLLPAIIQEKGEKVLIFSQFTSLLDILELYLNCRKYKFLRLDGSTPVLERQELINEFNTDPSIPVFLLSTKAGGLGINLTAANHIIIHDIDMNPYNDKQAEDRCHRMGQTKEVHVTRLIGKNSIEEQMLALAHQKLELERNVTSSSTENGVDIERHFTQNLLQQVLQQHQK